MRQHLRLSFWIELAVATIILGLLAFATSLPAAATPSSPHQPAQPSAAQLEDWHTAMRQLPLPKQGCATATYPAMQWQEVPCVAPPNIPMPPKRQPRPLIVGNGADVSAQAPSGFISSATGSFDAGTNVTGEAGQVGGGGGQIANAYSLQLNTNFFASSDCSANPGCQGWEQFIYESDGASPAFSGAYIQYWLLSYNTTCPGGWNTYMVGTDTYCWRNSTGSVSVPNQAATNLNNVSVTGAVSAGADSVTLAVGGSMFAQPGNNFVHAAAGWQIAEFNVVGDGGSGQANFTGGTTIIPRTRIIYGGASAPNCVAQGFTGETNNLSFGPGAPAISGSGPAVFFNETNAGGALTSCSSSTSIGDTHLATFSGLLYDFQASGDYVLAQAGTDFVVHARQVSGAPTWPDAAVNHAVATRMLTTTVAICPAVEGPPLVYIDRKLTRVVDNEPVSLPGVDIWKEGNVYTILDQAGDAVRAVVNNAPNINSYIDVSVGLGASSDKATGLLVNANNNVSQIAARDGTVLTAPFFFPTFYGLYQNSWRVPPIQDTLLSVCGQTTENGVPSKPLYARDLDIQLSAPARKICEGAGVTNAALLDACTLDVAVLNTETAARVYVGMPAPVAVGEVLSSTTQTYLPLITKQ